jgi:hypothetical protein
VFHAFDNGEEFGEGDRAELRKIVGLAPYVRNSVGKGAVVGEPKQTGRRSGVDGDTAEALERSVQRPSGGPRHCVSVLPTTNDAVEGFPQES